jgi:hypothetical protein
MQSSSFNEGAGLTSGLVKGPVAWRNNGELAFYPGFYLFAAGTAEGKTLHALALAHQLSCSMTPFMEPRAPSVNQDAKGVGDAITKESIVNAFTSAVDATGDRKVTIIDSVTYVISMLGSTISDSAVNVTFKGGLQLSDILGVLQINSYASRMGICVIGTLNASLFPRTADLEGACEGSISIVQPGVLSIRDRATRQPQLLRLSKKYLDMAVRDLGYGEEFKAGSTSTGYSMLMFK